MQKTKILATGGAGFIGSHLVEKLAACGYHVKVLDNLSTGKLLNINSDLLSSGAVEFIEGDIRDVALVRNCVKNVDAVVHLAAQTSVPFSIQNPGFNNDVNIKGSLNLLNACSELHVRKFVFISSSAVYGDPVYLPVDEQNLVNPISPYAASKLAIEKECLRLNKEKLLDSIIFRFFNVYGPRQGLNDYSGVITKFLDSINQRQPLLIYGDGSQTRDFVYVEDIVNAVTLALENDEAIGEVFNIGSGKATSIKKLAQTMLTLTKMDLKICNAPARKGEIMHSCANISKANKLLGYKPQFTIKHGLKKLLLEKDLLDKSNS